MTHNRTIAGSHVPAENHLAQNQQFGLGANLDLLFHSTAMYVLI